MDDAELLQRLKALLESTPQATAASRVDFADTLDDWTLWLIAQGKRPNTVTTYRRLIVAMRKQGLDVMRMTAPGVIAFSAQHAQRLKPRTLVSRYAALRSWAEFTGQSFAVGALKAPPVDEDPLPLPPAEDVKRLRDAMRPSKHAHGPSSNRLRRDGVIFDLLFEGALRISEALALTLDDLKHRNEKGATTTWRPGAGVALTHIHVRNSKGGKSRYVPLTPPLRRSLENWVTTHRPRWAKPDLPPVFQRDDGAAVTDKNYRQRLKRYGRRIGVSSFGGRTHHGRRIKITTLVMNRAVPSAIIRVTGHKKIANLEPYIRISDAFADREWLEKS